jgi:leader peptidase (prepilin peptidase)/N-methyltransferase
MERQGNALYYIELETAGRHHERRILVALEAAARAGGTAAVLLLVRSLYARLRNREGLGFGDVKLAAGIGAWLPLDAIPACFALAAGAALVAVLLAHLRGRQIEAVTRIPFGAFLCPALWLVFVSERWPG